MTDHDPGDEDRSPDGPWCVHCGDAFEAPPRDCPNPAPGRPYVDCGRGGHMFSAREPVKLVDFQTAIPRVCSHEWEVDGAVPWRVGGLRCAWCSATGYRDSLGRVVVDR